MHKLLREILRTIICIPVLLFYFFPMLIIDAVRGFPFQGQRFREIEKAGSIQAADAKSGARPLPKP